MTKTLILVRHAKSSHQEIDKTDFERVLSPRGEKDAESMSKKFAQKNIHPDRIFSSTATRAISTAKYFAKELGIKTEEIQKESQIYNSGISFIQNLLPALDNSLKTIMLFGHNPDFTYLYNYYSGVANSNMSTCSVACLDFETESWSELECKNANVRFFQRP